MKRCGTRCALFLTAVFVGVCFSAEASGESDAATIASIAGAVAARPPDARTVVYSPTSASAADNSTLPCSALLNVSSNATGAEHGAPPTNVVLRVPAEHAVELRGCDVDALWGVALRVELGAGAWFVVGGASRLQLGGLTLHGHRGEAATSHGGIVNGVVVVMGGSLVDVRVWAALDGHRRFAAALAAAVHPVTAATGSGELADGLGVAVVGGSRVTAHCPARTAGAVCNAAAVAIIFDRQQLTARRLHFAAANGTSAEAHVYDAGHGAGPIHPDARAAAFAPLVGVSAGAAVEAEVDGLQVRTSGGSALSNAQTPSRRSAIITARAVPRATPPGPTRTRSLSPAADSTPAPVSTPEPGSRTSGMIVLGALAAVAMGAAVCFGVKLCARMDTHEQETAGKEARAREPVAD